MRAFDILFEKVAASKPNYSVRNISELAFDNDDEVWTAKIDGAHSIIQIEPGQVPKVTSHRTSKKTKKLIEYTSKLPSIKTTGKYKAVVRGEVFAVDRAGRAVHPDVVTALLNSNLERSLQLQKDLGIKTQIALIDVDSFNGEDLSKASYAKKREILEMIAKSNPGFVLPDAAYTLEDKKRLLDSVLSKTHPQTKEGIVVHSKTKGIPFAKAKVVNHYDVYLTDIFPEGNVKEGRKPMAGGFTYAWEPGGKTVGKVGTGFNHAMKEDMLKNPDKYIGKVALVKALDLSKNKVLVKPSFAGWHVDKNIEASAFNFLFEKTAALKPDVVLKPHQEMSVKKPGNSVVYAHAVGSGKTLTSIAKFEKWKEEGKAKKALVIVPASLRENYASKGVKKFTTSKVNIIGNKQEVASGFANLPDPTADYNVVSYELFRADPERYIKETGADTLILDEHHRTKNEGTVTTESFKKVRDQYQNFIGLTGSIVSNQFADVLPLVDIASKGRHGLAESKDQFMDRFAIRNKGKAFKGIHKKRIPMTGIRYKGQLANVLGKYIDYLGIEEVRKAADMPDKKLKVEKVPISREQAKLYKKILRDKPDMMKMIREKRMEIMKDDESARAFSKLQEARKLMNSLGSTVPGYSLAESIEQSPKTKELLEDMYMHLQEDERNRALLLTHLVTGGVDILEEGLKQKEVPYGKFIGKGNKGVTEAIRQQAVRDFNKGKIRAMIASPAGGEGLSLDDTTWIGVLDPHYNPEKMTQMEARGIRSGGLKYKPEKERFVDTTRYIATMPRTLGVFKSSLLTPDEFIYGIAQVKERQNKIVHDFLRDIKKREDRKILEKEKKQERLKGSVA